MAVVCNVRCRGDVNTRVGIDKPPMARMVGQRAEASSKLNPERRRHINGPTATWNASRSHSIPDMLPQTQQGIVHTCNCEPMGTNTHAMHSSV